MDQQGCDAHDSGLLLDDVAGALQMLLNRMHCGLILLSSDGAVVYLNGYADGIVRAADAIAIRSRRLLFLDRTTQEQFRRRLGAARVTSSDGVEGSFAFRVARTRASADYLAVHSPLSCSTFAAAPMHRALWLFEPASVRCITPALLMQLHGLTPAQAQVAHALFLGLSAIDVSRELRISRHTVKTHLKDIFARCGVHSQAQLLRLIALTPALTSAPPRVVAIASSRRPCEAYP